MARGNDDGSRITLQHALSDICSTTLKKRADGLTALKHIFEGSTKAENIKLLDDKAYHKILEDLFRVVVEGKRDLASSKKTSTVIPRLRACADAVRIVLEVATFKLKAKSVVAVIDHIIQTLPNNTDDGYCEPIAQHYLRSLSIVLERQTTVEHLKIPSWLETVDFCLDGINWYAGENEVTELTGLSRSHSIGRTQSQAGSISRQNVEQLLQSLSHLVAARNAPILQRCDLITVAVFAFLKSRGSVSQLQRVAFSILNTVLVSTREDQISTSKTIAKEAVPIMCHFWQGKSVAKDEMLNSVRDEMLILLFLSCAHVECLVKTDDDGLVSKLSELLDAVKVEYARRSERDQLQLEDLDMSDLGAVVANGGPFQLNDFRLSLHNKQGERNWANLLCIGILECLVSLNHHRRGIVKDAAEKGIGEHSRKRQRLAQPSDRLLTPLKSNDPSVRVAALQSLPFALQHAQIGESVLVDILEQLCFCAADKRGNIASWALLAIASCTHQNAATTDIPFDWMQLWHAGARSITYASTCRAASAQLHAMLATGLIQYHEVKVDVEAMLTTADISGPAMLCDSSILLMTHLLHVRVSEVPGASLASCSNATRWLLSRWNPAERSSVFQSGAQMSPSQVVDLLRTAMGLPRLVSSSSPMVCDSLAQAWKLHLMTRDTLRYLLLLDHHLPEKSLPRCSLCPDQSIFNHTFHILDTGRFQSIRKLILELCSPKVGELVQNWTKFNEERAMLVSSDSFRRSIDACVVFLLLLPHYVDSALERLPRLKGDLGKLIEELFKPLNEPVSRDSKITQTPLETLLNTLQPHLPACKSTEMAQFARETPDLQKFVTQFSDVLERHRMLSESTSAVDGFEMMDIDGFATQQSNSGATGQADALPRHDLALDTSSRSFFMNTTCRVTLLAAMDRTPCDLGSVPSEYIEQLLLQTQEEVLLCRSFLVELLKSDLMMCDDDTLGMVRYMGENFVGSSEYNRCEVALGTCLDVLSGLTHRWTKLKGTELGKDAKDLYDWFVSTAFPSGIVSQAVLKGTANLLFLLMKLDEETASYSPSPRTLLFQVIQKGNASVQFYVGNRIPTTFELYTLKAHDRYFADLVEILPRDAEQFEGLAFRLFLLMKLAFRWPNLLRRCIYHIFEIPGMVKENFEHASRGLSNITTELKLDSSSELFKLFAPQILFTWLDTEALEDIPYAIFGYPSLQDLLLDAQDEATGLLIMRGQNDAVDHLSELLGTTKSELLEKTFGKVMAYSITKDIASGATLSSPGEMGPREKMVLQCLGKEKFFHCLNSYLADITSLLFIITDHEGADNHLGKQNTYPLASKVLKDIKTISSSKVTLPVDQQPFFKAKFLTSSIRRLLSPTSTEPKDLFTPPLVTSISRQMIQTIHPALGSLHACSVLRKLRILISFAGQTAVEGYPLEMLLHTVRPFMTDSECADDAIGIVQYLIKAGNTHLLSAPSFVASITLSIFGSLRVFLESTPATTTQESQFKQTLSKAQTFHAWMGKYVAEYSSPSLPAEDKPSFRALVITASKIGSVGNAEVGTAESKLLDRLLKDEKAEHSLLNRQSRELAFEMLSSEFKVPTSFRTDFLGGDDLAIKNAAGVWKSCRGGSTSKEYLSWAARVLGRAFASSGHIHQELLQESSLAPTKELSPTLDGKYSSETYVLNLLRSLMLGHDRRTAGLAESALRVIITNADDTLDKICRKVLPATLTEASNWLNYHTPPSDLIEKDEPNPSSEHFAIDSILSTFWARDLSIYLALSAPESSILSPLVPIFRVVPKFADRAFPYILHLVLSTPSKDQSSTRKKLGATFTTWLEQVDIAAGDNLKLLINALLYLRTQPFPNERSQADRSQWLDIEYLKAATAAKNCGMFRTALLFTEEFYSDSGHSKGSRRSSATHQPPKLPVEFLLAIFENVDDPDLYYGVQQVPSLSAIQSRLDYEKDGPKSLAFRGAQYDSHVRSNAPGTASDIPSLVNALDVLSQSGLSYSLLRAQTAIGMDAEAQDSMFRTAQKLEQWDIEVPNTRSSNSVTLYKAFQAVNSASGYPAIMRAINEGLDCTMTSLLKEDLGAKALHDSLQTLAALVEMDEIFSSQGGQSQQFEGLVAKFRERESWMKIGNFEDVNQILSCRGTTLSTLSQRPRLHEVIDVRPVDTRFVEVQAALLASGLTRAHNSLQDSLSLATSLIDLIPPCRKLSLHVDFAIQMEAANALWDQGELAASVGMLQSLEKQNPASYQKQQLAVGRSKILTQLGSKSSEARLEKPDKILENYLKPALSELKAKNDGTEAGQVFHQFAVFCDQQLQDADGLEDLERLKKLSRMKEDEVRDLSRLVNLTPHNDRTKVKQALAKARLWLKLDQDELHRQLSSRDEFLRQSLENYILALSAFDEHENDALRFTALWLQHSETQIANEAVSKHILRVASRKFAPLVNQLTSRLQESPAKFHKLLYTLVLRIATEHPFHAMYQIYAGANTRANANDEPALQRTAAAFKLAKALSTHPRAGFYWNAIYSTNAAYCQLAAEREGMKTGRKIKFGDSKGATKLYNMVVKYSIPSPTKHIELAPDLDYSKVSVMTKFETVMSIASGVSMPKIIIALGSDGLKYKQLVKGGEVGKEDDLRQDAIMEQVFEQVSDLLKTNRQTRQRNLRIRTYKVFPLTSIAGIIEFVSNTVPLHEYLLPAHVRYHPNGYNGTKCRNEISEVQTSGHSARIAKFKKVTENFPPVMRHFFTEHFTNPDEWFVKRLAYTRSTAAISILGHVLGIGDRHGHNILLDAQSGEVVHIDLGVAFEMGRVLQIPEIVPFRLTRDIVDGMGITKTEGVFRRCCEFTLEALRKETYSIMTILDVLRYDPLYNWSISPVRLAKLQEGNSSSPEQNVNKPMEKDVANNELEADRALTVVNKKLSKTLSVTATVNDLINQAKDENNLALLYSGWAAYA